MRGIRHLLFLPLAFSLYAAPSAYDLPVAWSAERPIHTETVALSRLTPGNYTLLFSVPPQALGPEARLQVDLMDGQRQLLHKTLHAGDADLYAPFHLGESARAELRLSAAGVTGRYSARIDRWPVGLKRGNNHTWREADAMKLGDVVFSSSDEVEYIPVPGESRRQYATDSRGEDWYRFHFDGPRPKLVFFQLELTDRDDLPVDVSIFREKNGAMEEYTRGQDPFAVPHEVQALPGNKFAPRVLEESGDYFVRVRANHPEYKLRTRVYNVPPYSDPHEAVRTAVDYIMGAGEAWFANTPRRGGTLDRVTPVHQETSLCVGCHPSHFSQRAQLYSIANGYPVVQRQQLRFLEDRFYNNPRPFYGFEDQGAVWARVISAPANVLSRMSLLTGMFEDQVSRQPRPDYHRGIAKYIDLYYAGRDKLPPDETNGNTPLVSTFEVAWYSWKTTKDSRLPEMIARAEVKNMNDLDYQTLALGDIDREKYKEQINRNVARILSLQRPDGQWSMRFEPNEPEVEFATGHTLWALAAAGVPVDDPQVAKAVHYLMGRQQTFGGWMDPKQSYENFRTPFRETQFAVVALSSYYPLKDRARGWNSPPVTSLGQDPAALLNQLDRIWDQPSTAVVRQIEQAAQSNEVLVRQAAAEALGRLSLPSSAPVLSKLLGDPSKLVQRTAAWGLRQLYANHPETDDHSIAAALASADARTRWGATRIFAHHFSVLAKRNDLVDDLAKLSSSEPVIAVRMQAIRGLWQSWFWNADEKTRGHIEDTLIAALGAKEHPWIDTNVHAAVYNLADENIRYLYNNWVTLLGRNEDRRKAIEGRLAIESRLAEKFAAVLTSGNDARKKALLAALVDVPQRRADIYDLDSNLSTPLPPVYNR
ncbi:MAG TPA: HEAT repeat domain-containing protein, partial [Bryobacteraceae bacterium]|nr:HEAT repeat domain-containing protein [Bryobacteraceae bacterium]